ncbi:TNT domain-containing protein [Saccharothrix variisporea]|uniref:Uncharacterized protein DUF4237 n=1 Tax=Saccharothrix variisporea TaxID=543527 RepID=A0A495XGA9_9PSEU|nr:TNT domain-containing protein [Saccharothrix variisporea]RKT72246.1 uncharacterized protein DUF4237 [Saccharothrix variisporea]
MVGVSEPKPLNPTEQDALVKQIGLTLMRAAPEDWRHVTAEYRATGRYFELAAEVRSADGALRAWQPPQEVAGLFARLRAGMYREGRGSWSNARYQLDHPSSYNLDFDRAEPAWQTPPPPQAYVDEVRFFPRTDENMPDWLRRRLAAAQPPAPHTPPGPALPAQPGPPTPPGGQPALTHDPRPFGTPHDPAAHEPHAFGAPHDPAAHEPHAFGAPHDPAAFGAPHDPAAPFGAPHEPAAEETQLFPPPPHEAAHPEPPFAPPAHEPQAYDAPAQEAPEHEAHHPGPSTPGLPGPSTPGGLPAPSTPGLPGPSTPGGGLPGPSTPGGGLPGPSTPGAGLPAAPVLTSPVPPRGFRTARVFDGAGPGGRPAVNRPPVPEAERDLLLSYLDRAPVAVVGRGFDADVLNPDAPAVVPVAFQTDGHWIWPAAVGYYLRAYGVPPEPELVERAKANDYVLPEVPEDARVAAAANLGAPAAPRDTALPVAEVPEPFQAFAEQPHDEPAEVAETVATPLPEPPDQPEPPRPDARADARADARSDVEETANLTELRADRVEFADSGPPYRVRFEEDGPVIDDRYRRESYVDGMDLFAPAQYERDAEDVETTQAWNPFAEEQPDTAPAEETAEVEVVTDEPAAEEPVAEDPQYADEPEFADQPAYGDQPAYTDQPEFSDQPDYSAEPEFADEPEAEPEPEVVEAAEQTTEFDQFHEEPRFEQQPQFDEPAQFGEQAQFDQPAQFGEQAQFGEPDRFAEDERFTEEQPRFEDQEPPAPPAPVEPRQVTPEEEQQLSGVRRALDELDVPPAAYRFGEPVDRTWLLRTEGRDWEVSWFDHGPTNPVRFDRLEDAAAYLVGKLVLTGRRTPRPLPPPPPRPQPPRPPMNGEPFREEPHRPPVENFREEPHRAPDFREEPHRPQDFREEPHRPPLNGEPFRDERPPLTNGFREEPPRRPAPPQPQPQESPKPAARQWPITPLNGEPPLTLFRHKKMVELPAGMEVDRFGDGSGNLVYVAGTPFAERSLVPSWINRPYRVYRLRRPVEVLTGVAVPWFEQPGGGTAYLLPKSVEDLIADGVLVEVANQEAPAH